MKGNETAKKVLGFLFFRSAFTQRNVTSIGLVILFFVIYVLAGGKIDAIPKIQTDPGTFGGINPISETQTGKNKIKDKEKPVNTELKKNSEIEKSNVDEANEASAASEKNQQTSDDPFANIEKKLRERKKN